MSGFVKNKKTNLFRLELNKFKSRRTLKKFKEESTGSTVAVVKSKDFEEDGGLSECLEGKSGESVGSWTLRTPRRS